jgi:four helix bundle protein
VFTFVALDVSLELVTAVAAPLARIRSRDADLARQLRRAVQSVALNIAEGLGRDGGHRRQFFRHAYGSLREARTALTVAAAFGYLRTDEAAAADRVADRLGGLIWPFAR